MAGRKEGSAFNFHYQSNGYHPPVYYDGLIGNLIKIQLRDGTRYSCTGVVDFLQPILVEYLMDYPEAKLLLRGGSGIATPELYKQCEENGTVYVIRLKENTTLCDKTSVLANELDGITKDNKVEIAAKVIHSARYITFKLCSRCPYKNEFYGTLANIGGLPVQLE